jgi:GTPase SAR1 family protein
LLTHAALRSRDFEVPYFNTAQVFGSQAILDKIKDHFKVDSDGLQNVPRCIVLYGMGGVGKSTLAHTYATIFRNNYEGVFWSSARQTGGVAGLDAVKLDFLKWARVLNKSFLEWANTPDRKWLLVIDNFDEFFGASLQGFRETLPHGGTGHIIVTSRRLRATVFGTHSIRVEPLPPADSVPMLLAFSFNRAKTSRDEDVARDIVSRLGGLPLAIRQCAAYANRLQLRLADYPERIQILLEQIDTGLDADDIEISSQSGEDNAEYQKLFATGEMSFRQLLESSPLAADVLTIMAYLDAADIAEAVLSRGFGGMGGWDERGNWTHAYVSTFQCTSLRGLLQSARPKTELSRALATLVDFSLIQRTSYSNSFSLHPVRLAKLFEDFD